MLVREQLITEKNARIEAQVWMCELYLKRKRTKKVFNSNNTTQARYQQLLQQNRELLEHLASLGGYNESDRPGLTSATIGLAPQVNFSLN